MFPSLHDTLRVITWHKRLRPDASLSCVCGAFVAGGGPMKELTLLARSGNPSISVPRPFTRTGSPARGTELVGAIQFAGTVMSFAADVEIYGESEPADYLYKLLSGAVRTYKVLLDGRRQVGAFYLSGDIFGLGTG